MQAPRGVPGEGDRSQAASGWGGHRRPPGSREGVRRVKAFAPRVALTGLDQCVASLSNFVVGVAVARVAGIAALGAYSLAYVTWLALAGVHRAIVAEPMAIEDDVRQPDAAKHLQAGLAAELALGIALGGALASCGLLFLALHQRAYGVAFLALGPWVPCLLVQDYWRWVSFMRTEPKKALTNDLLFDAAQGVVFTAMFAAGIRSSVLAIGAWGMGACAGSIFGLWQHSVQPSWRGGLRRIRERWPISRGLLGGSVTSWGSQQSYVILTGALLGPVGIGALRAALSLVTGPTYMLLQAGGSIGLPEASKALHDRGLGGLRKVERTITAAGALSIAGVGAVVLVYGKQLLSALYGPSFSRYGATADLLALSVVVGTSSLGAILGLKVTRSAGMLFASSVVALVVSIAAVLALVPAFGVEGAAAAAVARSAAGSAAQLLFHRRALRTRIEPPSEGAPPFAGAPVAALVPRGTRGKPGPCPPQADGAGAAR